MGIGNIKMHLPFLTLRQINGHQYRQIHLIPHFLHQGLMQ
jgi:hypothetical protein